VERTNHPDDLARLKTKTLQILTRPLTGSLAVDDHCNQLNNVAY